MKPQFRHCRWMIMTTALILAASWTNHGYADAPEGRYTIGDGTVLDTKTNLEWQQTISEDSFTWEAAKTHCSTLSLNGSAPWRLPSMKELQTLVDRRRMVPAIDLKAFPNTPAAHFWTSSPLAGSASDAWYVGFDYGNTYYDAVTNTYRVRCVR